MSNIIREIEMWNTNLRLFERHRILNTLSGWLNIYTVTTNGGQNVLQHKNWIEQLVWISNSVSLNVYETESGPVVPVGLKSSYNNT